VLALAGCGRGQVKIADGVPEDRDKRLGEKTAIDLPGWLSRRTELAKLTDEYDTTLDKQREGVRRSPLPGERGSKPPESSVLGERGALAP
jgi:hypothetical protein